MVADTHSSEMWINPAGEPASLLFAIPHKEAAPYNEDRANYGGKAGPFSKNEYAGSGGPYDN